MKIFYAYIPVFLLLLTACADLDVGKQAKQDGDYVAARKNYEKLADFGYPEAQIAMADMLVKGQGGPVDTVKAKEYLQKAYEQGDARAAYQLAMIYEKEENFQRAGDYYKQALQEDYPKAAVKLGKLYNKGKGRVADPVTGLAYYYYAQNHNVQDVSDDIEKIESKLTEAEILQARDIAGRISVGA
jgi:TPR repeat protein